MTDEELLEAMRRRYPGFTIEAAAGKITIYGHDDSFTTEMEKWSISNPPSVVKNGWIKPTDAMPTDKHYDNGYVLFVRYRSDGHVEEAIWGNGDTFWLDGAWDLHATADKYVSKNLVKCWTWIPLEDGDYEKESELK